MNKKLQILKHVYKEENALKCTSMARGIVTIKVTRYLERVKFYECRCVAGGNILIDKEAVLNHLHHVT